MVPLLALASSTLNAESATGPHSTQLLEVIAEHLGIHTANIEDFDLRLFDVQPGTLGGANDEFIFAGRLDNLFSTYCATAALSMTEDKSLEADTTTHMIALCECVYQKSITLKERFRGPRGSGVGVS
jgi:aspartyl aminopeptidase